ncbi:MAG: hypothetical protein AABZ06_08850 [Bdellovibrionota bacterium]
MKKTAMSLVVIAMVFGQAALAVETGIECVAKGKSLANNGGGLLTAAATLSFAETKNAQGLRVLKNIEGRIQSSPENADSSYIGNFKIASLTENPNYRPNKYKGYSQFQSFDATDTTNSVEDGMWGQLVLEKNTSKRTFQAHYIFQAGDHMGGTLHLVC